MPLFVGGEWIPRGRIVIASLAGNNRARHPGQFHHAGKCDQGAWFADLHTVTVPCASASHHSQSERPQADEQPASVGLLQHRLTLLQHCSAGPQYLSLVGSTVLVTILKYFI